MTEQATLNPLGFGRESASVPLLASLSRSSLALDNLRGVVILIVLAFHSSLAYVSFAPATTDFDAPPYSWRAFPIIDSDRFLGLDLFCAWQDVYLMSLMFFLSGLFVGPSLARKKGWAFLRDRVLRLGVPYVFGIFVIMVLATYPSYSVTAADPSIADYWRALLALPFWPIGPPWFLWELLVLNVLAAALHWIAPNAITALGRWSTGAETRLGPYFGCLLAASVLAYVPLAIAFTPWEWFHFSYFGFQLCRPLQYTVYFFAGVGVGVEGLDRGLIAVDGMLARHWARWLAAALASLALWMGLTGLTLNGDASVAIQIADDLAFVLACACGCFFFIAASLRFVARPSRLLGSLGANAYALYLLHYVFVVWLQFALLAVPLFALIKATIVFGGTLLLSWITATVVQRVPLGARLIGSPRRQVARIAT